MSDAPVSPLARGATPRRPRALRHGATLRFVAPSGCLDGESDIDRARDRLCALGYKVQYDAGLFGRWKYFSAPDTERAAAFMDAATAADVDAVVAARGGYGLTRLLPLLDFERIAAARKIFVGFSDFTAFHLAALARGPLVTFAGPMAAVDLGAESPSDSVLRRFEAVLGGTAEPLHAESIRDPGDSGRVSGTLWGGNLSLVAHLLGTPYFPVVDGGILFLEEVNEQPYQIERMLMALWHAGVLARQRAILIGSITGSEPTGRSRVAYTLDDALDALAERFAGPVLCGLPFGHTREKTTLPVGARADLEWNRGNWQLALADYIDAAQEAV